MTEEQGLAAIDEAVSARLIEEVPGGTERFQFSHALVQRTLADELTTPRRVRLHALVAAAMEEQYGDDAGSHAAELAYHFAQAEPLCLALKSWCAIPCWPESEPWPPTPGTRR